MAKRKRTWTNNYAKHCTENHSWSNTWFKASDFSWPWYCLSDLRLLISLCHCIVCLIFPLVSSIFSFSDHVYECQGYRICLSIPIHVTRESWSVSHHERYLYISHYRHIEEEIDHIEIMQFSDRENKNEKSCSLPLTVNQLHL
jgi:hypothetical protein